MEQEHTRAVARYLEGDMEMQEMIAFESQLKQSVELRQAMEAYKNSKSSLKIEKEPVPLITPTKEKTGSKKPYFKYIVIIGLVLAVGLFMRAPWKPSLYERYAISRTMPMPKRGSDAQENIAKGAELFNEGHYEKARKLLQSEYMLNPQNPSLSYYFAITLVETGKEYEARTIFMNLYKGETVFKYDAAYFVALSFIKEGNKAAAVEWLQKIPAGNANSGKAKELIGHCKNGPSGT
jgi:tetratricopeptide (TPR) repeat protein